MTPEEPGDHEKLIIPPGNNPVEFMLAAAAGTTYRRYANLAEARRHDDATLVMVADFGGQVLLTSPVRHITASEPALTQLLLDLEDITWGLGFDARPAGAESEASMHFEPRNIGSGVVGGRGGGAVVDGLWLHPELEVELCLRDEIERVLRGQRPRIAAPHGFPDAPLSCLEVAKLYPYGRVSLVSGVRGYWRLVSCPARMVQIGESQIYALLAAIDAKLRKPVRWGNQPPPDEPSRVLYQIEKHEGSRTLAHDEVLWHRAIDEESWRSEILATLRGERPYRLPERVS